MNLFEHLKDRLFPPNPKFYQVTFKVAEDVITYKGRRTKYFYIMIVPFDVCPQRVRDNANELFEEGDYDPEMSYPPLFTEFRIPIEHVISAQELPNAS